MTDTPIQIDKYAGQVLLEQASYFKGRRHGTTVYYRSDGRIERIATFWYDQLNGPYYEFWPSGRLALEATYVYNALDTQIEYNELGQRIGPSPTLHARPGVEIQRQESLHTDSLALLGKFEPSILRVTQYRPE